MTDWKRHRFTATEGDARPTVFPPPGPFWCTGYSASDEAIVVAYLPASVEVHEWWPDAEDIDTDDAPDGPQFSDRFRQPTWWTQ